MRRLVNTVTGSIATLLLSVLLLLCSVGVYAAHNNDGNQPKANCNASCHSHGQNLGINNLVNEEDEDDKEPTPPLAYWLQAPVNLVSLYVMPIIAVLWFISEQRKILLTTRLRF